MWTPILTLISPKKFISLSNTLFPWFVGFFLCTFAYGLIGGLVLAPADYMQGDGFRILYVHAPAAFVSLFVYVIMTGAAIALLVWRIKIAGLVIRHSAPIGAIFTALALVTGSIWGKPMWGTWWLWDARLTSELILLFIYIAIILFAGATQHKPQSDRLTAILIIIGCVDLPIIHYSVFWWNTLHQGPTLKLFSPSSIDPSMLHPLLAMIAAFMSYYAIVLTLRLRYSLLIAQARTHWLRAQIC